jgi:UDP-N-acetylmuramoylalanine--D-glutamate ligase
MTMTTLRTSHPCPYRAKKIAIVGMGVTGRACTGFLLRKGAFITAFDRQVLDIHTLRSELDVVDTSVSLGAFLAFELLTSTSCFDGFDYVVLSPGINPEHPALAAIRRESRVISDLDIFAQYNAVPCIGVTGSNGKSTVVDMLQKTLTAAGKKTLLGGNFGTAALDLVDTEADFIVLELSSFQLEITRKLPLAVACILNVTEDHIDRHHTLLAYTKAKQRIFTHAAAVVINLDDAASYLPNMANICASVSAKVPEGPQTPSQFWQDGQGIKCQSALVLSADKLSMPLPHLLMNMQFVLAIHHCLHLPLAPAVKILEHYQGLPHRFERVHQIGNITFINDSKATNPGACLAALECAKRLNQRTILIAGGDAKGADLSVLKEPIDALVDCCIVFGKDAKAFVALTERVMQVDTLEQAVSLAKQKAEETPAPTLVLLSPACASIDMFDNYQQRGDRFKQAVLGEGA